MAFFNEIVNITKNAQNVKITKELERDADSLTKFIEKKIKDCIRKEAEKGGDFIEFDLIGIDTNYKYSVEELMWKRIIPDFVPVQHRLFDKTKNIQDSGPFEGFKISSNDTSVIVISWTTQSDEDVHTPIRQPQTSACPPAPLKQSCATYSHIGPYIAYMGPYDQNTINNFPQHDGGALDGNVDYISHLLEDLFPNLIANNKVENRVKQFN